MKIEPLPGASITIGEDGGLVFSRWRILSEPGETTPLERMDVAYAIFLCLLNHIVEAHKHE